MVTMVPPITSRSTFSSAGVFFAACFGAFACAQTPREKPQRNTDKHRYKGKSLERDCLRAALMRFTPIFGNDLSSAVICVHPWFQSLQRKEESKGRGKSADMRCTSTLPARFDRITGTSPQNSQMICRHEPQGGVSTSVCVTTAMASKQRSPSEMALKIATRSAQTVRPYVAFSTLQPI